MLSWPIAGLLFLLAKNSTYIAEEIFANVIYRYYSQALSFIIGLLPFSLAEIVILVVPLLLAFLIVQFIIHMIRNKEERRLRFAKAGINVLCFLGLLLFLFMLGCGTNYYRYSFTYYSDLEIQESSTEELKRLCMDLADRTNQCRSQISSEDEHGVFLLKRDSREIGRAAVLAIGLLGRKYEVLAGYYPEPKPVMFSGFMSRLQITGIFIPFTMEANINIHASDYSIAATMCHELAHLKGFMREEEANYISYLACTASDDVELQYSGLMQALILAGNALYSENPDYYYEVSDTYSDGVVRDLEANSLYWKQYENTILAEVSEKMNDTYLKLNDQGDGVHSYGRMVDLLLAEFRNRN